MYATELLVYGCSVFSGELIRFSPVLLCAYMLYWHVYKKCIFQFYIADMRIADSKENVKRIKNSCIVRFQVDTFFFNPFIGSRVSVCVLASRGWGGVQRVGRGVNI